MTIYYIVYFIIAITALFECILCRYERIKIGSNLYESNYIHKKIVFLEIAILCLISAFRGETVGIDMARYVPRYKIIAETPWIELGKLPSDWGFECGWIILCKLIGVLFGGSTFAFIFITSLITVTGFYFFIREFSAIPVLSLLIYVAYGYWSNSFNVVRQYMAISMLAVALVYLIRDKKNSTVIAVMFTILATLFHTSSIVFVPIFFVKHLRYDLRVFLLFLFASIGVGLLPDSCINWILEFTPYSWYINRPGSGESILVISFIILFAVFLRKRKIIKFDKNIDIWLWMLSIAIFANLFALTNGLFERIMRVYLVAWLIAVPDFVYSFRKNSGYAVIFLSVIIAFSLYYFLILMLSPASSSGAIPYRFVF